MADFTVIHAFAHPPETVFDAWLDPKTAARFLFATPTGEMIRAEVDARVGGRFTFTDRRPEMGDVEHTGEYLTIDRPRRLVFTFAVPKFDPGYTRVEVEITATPAGCLVHLTQCDTPDAWVEPSTHGWQMILDRLDHALTP